jgi:hypothetical protein
MEMPDKFADDPRFVEFLYREFDKTVPYATLEDIAKFAFGSVELAISAYKENDS